MAVEQKSLFFYDDATPSTYREHAIRGAGTSTFHLFFGKPGFFGGAINQVNPARLRVTGKAWAGGTSLRFRFQYSKDATVNETTRVVSGGSWSDMGVDLTVAVADLPSVNTDDNSIVDVPLPYFEDLEGAVAMRLQVTGAGTFTAGDFDAYLGLTPNPILNAGHDTVTRQGYASQVAFQNFNSGRIN